MSRPCRAAPCLLLHVNLLLLLYAGAMLAAAARLKWDPTLYVAARELFPREYRAAAAALPALAVSLLLLAQLALAAARSRRRRRALLLLHAGGQLVVAGACASLGGWAAARGTRWADGREAGELRRALALREHALPLLQQLAQLHPLPERVRALLAEAEADLPRYLRALLAAAALLLLLQLLAAALALLAARRSTRSVTLSTRRNVQTRPRAVYRGGRLLLL